MLDVLNRFAHGFVVVPVVLACRKGGVFDALRDTALTAPQLGDRLAANAGHLQVTLRLLESLGWIDIDEDGRLHATSALRDESLIPEDVLPLIAADLDEYLREGTGGLLTPYIERSKRRWDVPDERIADYLDSLIVVPILGLMAKRKLLDRLPGSDFSILPAGVRTEVIDFLRHLEWLEGTKGSYQLTPAGQFMFERAMNLGVAESYRPMLNAVPELLFGDAEKVFQRDAEGHETHVDRVLNVIASGFMHDRFFAEVEDILVSVFSRDPISAQPRYVADMGSGDGTFLKRVFETVRDKTPRGKALDRYPLTMIGIDFNKASLDETSRTLGDIDHIVVTGDIGDPQQAVRSLSALDIDCDQVLHIRSFLDHDRPYKAPKDRQALAARTGARYLGAYVDPQGGAIPPAEAVQSLVEHLGLWAEVVNDHGLILLEVHCQDPLVVRSYIDQSESLYFDAIEGYSQQLLVEADGALMAAAEVGLFPRREEFRKYPNVLPYCRITLTRYERRPYRVRMARREDLPELLALEEACWPAGMRMSDDVLADRISRYALGQWVLEMDGRIAAVVYSQRVRDLDVLRGSRLDGITGLHDPNGAVVQLLGLNVLPDLQQLGLGDQLLDLILLRSSVQGGVRQVAGLTRCRNFRGGTFEELQQYVESRDVNGRPNDPILQFHSSHGARIVGAVANYRPEDADNLGAGVLICYDMRPSSAEPTEAGGAGAADGKTGDVRSRLESCLRTLLGAHRQHSFSWTRTLRDMGLDSLDLLEFRTLLQNTFTLPLSPTFFFSHPTLEEINRFLDEEAEHGGTPRQPSRGRVTLAAAAPAESDPAASLQPVAPAGRRESPAIAVIGMAGTFPGCPGIDDYWDLLKAGRDGISEVPADRWDVDAYYSENPDQPGKIVSRFGGFVDEVAGFDAAFFNIAPSEARLMDPQQRKLLEIHWEALENAGIASSTLRESACGIFVGLYSHDYELLQVAAGGEENLGAYYATGSSGSIAAGRIAYFLGTRGAALTIDTACSSSLVAVHQAMRSLRSGESEIAIASGVSLLLNPRLSIAFSKAGMLSPRGRCRTFDAGADGYVRSEGCAAIVLKRLSDAEKDGDPVLAVLRGSAINQDGASNGLTAPSLTAQQALLRRALEDAGLEPADIDYLEAHGTGTSLGDPVEFAAIREVFGADPKRREPLWLGSAKTNIGHAEAAAGIAGLVKVVLSLNHRTLPRHLHFREVNPHIDLDALPARIPVETTEWTRAGRPRRAGVSSFGFSGTNAHVIVEEAEVRAEESTTASALLKVLPLSARTPAALRALMSRYADWLTGDSLPGIDEICRAAACGRAHLAERRMVFGRNPIEMSQALRGVLPGASERVRLTSPPRVAFMFTGQGSQYVDMARELATDEPVFREALAECSRILDREMDVPLEDVLYPGDDGAGLIDNTAYTQPALFAVEYALARMLQHWGIRPAAVIGHSVGEYVAACIAGVFSLEDGLRLITARGRLMGSLPTGGAMAAVLGPAGPVERLVAAAGESLSIAAYNGPLNTVISGNAEAVQQATSELEEAGIKVVPLQVSHAFHSALMNPIVPAFREVLRWVRFSKPELPIASNANGRFVSAEIATTDYWARHLRQPVRFAEGIGTLLDDGINVMLEVGPHPVLTSMGQLVADERSSGENVLWTAMLARERTAGESIAECIATLYESGVDLDWSAFYSGTKNTVVRLPNYPWQRKHFWFRDIPSGFKGRKPADSLFEPRWSACSPLDRGVPARPARALPAASTLSDILLPVRDSARAEFAVSDVTSALDEECRNLVVTGLRKLGWTPVVGETASSSELSRELGILPKYERLLHRFLRMLAEDGFLSANGKGYTVVSEPPSVASRLDALVERHPECRSELNLLGTCAAGLDAVLRGTIDPLDLIFPGGDLSAAEAVYAKAPFAQVGNAMVVAAVERIVAERLPSPLRVLEIGAGTGGTTESILPLLPCDTDYVFTDLSPAFLERARARFNDYPNVRYELFDAEKLPAEQGFAAHQFDLVVAANVLHATEDLERSVRHAQQLLAEGGLLLLVEGLEPSRWVDLVFGLTDGWWRFADTALRPHYPLLDSTQWTALLNRCGFSSARIVGTSDPGARSSAADLLNQGIVIAQAAQHTHAAVELPQTGTSADWFILADAGGVGEHLAGLARREGNSCELVDVDATSNRVREALEATAASGDGKPLRVVDLRPLDTGCDFESAGALVDQAAAIGMNMIRLVRSLTATGKASLAVATRQAQSLRDGEVATAAGATVWGLGNVIAAENPKMHLRLIDLDGDQPAEEAALELYRELSADTTDRRAGFRAGQRYVPHFFPISGGDEELVCDESGVYLIVGGMGDLGLHTARWLVRHGARNVVLAGRTPFPRESEWTSLAQDAFYGPKIEVVKDLVASGIELRFMDVDVRDADAVRVLVQGLRAIGPVRGLVQAAAIISDRLVSEVSEEEYREVLGPKVAGTWQLLRALAEEPLDFCLFYSSIGSVVGLPGQASYAAANAFLDALARSGSHPRLKMLSINWCGWRETGLARTAGGQRAIAELELLGIGSLSPHEATALIERAFRSGTQQATTIPLASMDAVNLDSLDPLLAELRRRYFKESNEESITVARAPVTVPFKGMQGAELADAVKQTVIEAIAGLMDIDARAVTLDRSLGDMGMDSLLGLEFRKLLQGRCGVVLPATLVWSYPTARLVIERIVELLDGVLPARPAEGGESGLTSTASATPQDTALETLSDDDALRQLMGQS